jgi:hypothetical protein
MSTIVVRPVRFTDQLDEMRSFLEVLGLRARIESDRGTWVDMVAGAGMVALHSAADSATGAGHGETRLSFEAEDVYALGRRLEAQSVGDVVVYDEAYGQVLTCTDPLGDPVHIDGRSEDLYGYRLHQASPDPRIAVAPVLFTDPTGEYNGFLDALGFSRESGGDEYFVTYTASDEAGQIGLHYIYDGELPIVEGPAAVHLTFTTTEPLEDVAAKLKDAGYGDAEISADEFVALVSVTDPDGRECQIHQRTAAPA